MKSEDCLAVAQRAERWIDGYRHDTEHGVVWGLAAERPDKYLYTLYAGSAGILLFYLELFYATGEARYLEVARKAGDELIHQFPKMRAPDCAAMGGWVGYMFVLHQLFLASDDTRYLEAAAECAQRQRNLAQPIGAGIGWVQQMPYARLTGHEGMREIFDMAEGAAGAGTYWLYAHEQAIHSEALDWARAAADRLLEVAEPARGGLRWQLMPDIPWPFDAPNFAHGTAGVAYFMARTYACSNDEKYLQAAIAGAGHVQAMAQDIEGGGHLVPHILNDERPSRFYLGACHGPAGTGKLFYLLRQITGDAAWAEWGRGLDEGLVSLGAPETRGRGFWNNVSQCCCDAGIGDHAVNMYRAGGDEFYLDLALRIAQELVHRSQGDEAQCCWPQAEHRTQPDFIQAQTGYMQGAAGVGSFFVHLATTLAAEAPAGMPEHNAPEGEQIVARAVKIQFPDSPFS